MAVGIGSSYDPRDYARIIRDPVHGYVEVPQELAPILRTYPMARLRNISQNSRATAAYPGLNGSRFEHALGTMHLAMKAWDAAWQNVWGATDSGTDAERAALHGMFAQDVAATLKGIVGDGGSVASDTADAHPILDTVILDWYRSHSGDPESAVAIRELSNLLRLTVGAAGLLHDVGHPPFSHVLEPVFAKHSESIVGDGLESPQIDQLLGESAGTSTRVPRQFHEDASEHIVQEVLKGAQELAGVSSWMIRLVLLSHDSYGIGPSWAACMHSLVDGTIDVDRLDYIMRDSLRAGALFHAIDVHRLTGNLELHRVKRPSTDSHGTGYRWTIGVGVRGLSSVEALLLLREQSYRWMIFHQKAVLADASLQQVCEAYFDALAQKEAESQPECPPAPGEPGAVSRSPGLGMDACLQDFDYITQWSRSSPYVPPKSYEVDDHLLLEHLRAYRTQLAQHAEKSVEVKRTLAKAAVLDELNVASMAAWRHFGEYQEFVSSSAYTGARGYVESFVDAQGILQQGSDLERHGPLIYLREFLRMCMRTSFVVRGGAEPLLGARALQTWLDDHRSQLEVEVNENRHVVGGCWVVADKTSFRAIKDEGPSIWIGSRPTQLASVSPAVMGLEHANRMKAEVFFYFIPFESHWVDKEQRELRAALRRATRDGVGAALRELALLMPN